MYPEVTKDNKWRNWGGKKLSKNFFFEKKIFFRKCFLTKYYIIWDPGGSRKQTDAMVAWFMQCPHPCGLCITGLLAAAAAEAAAAAVLLDLLLLAASAAAACWWWCCSSLLLRRVLLLPAPGAAAACRWWCYSLLLLLLVLAPYVI